jgi:cation diffusion facilitator family transporter
MNVERWGWLSLGVNLVLALLNLAIAWASGSLAVTAEMMHNSVDVASAVAVLVGLRLATRESEDFPYGLYKVENIVAVGVSTLTLFTAYEIGKEALRSSASQPIIAPWIIGGVVTSALLPLVYSTLELQAGRRANSPALIASAQDHRTHIFTSGLVLAALLAQRVGMPLDRLAALVVVVVVGKSGWELLLDGMRVLLDASLDAETLRRIREAISEEPLVTEVKYVTGRNAGRYRFVESSVVLRTVDLEASEAAVQRIQQRIHEMVPNVDRALVYARPMPRTHLRYAVPLEGIDGAVSPHLGEAPYFGLATVRTSDGRVERQEIVANPHAAVPKAKGLRVAEWLVGLKVDVVLLREDLSGKGPMYVFGDAGVETRHTEARTFAQALSLEQQATSSLEDGSAKHGPG